MLNSRQNLNFLHMSDLTDAALRLRHSASHILAQAVLTLFPDAQLGTGPATADGFYYDFLLPRPITPEDLVELEKKMKHSIKQNQVFERSEMPIAEGKKFLADRGQKLKVELVEKFEKQGETVVSFYKNADFIDLCEGPHVGNTNEVKAVMLTKFSSSYWQGDSERESMQRIYGVAFASEEELQAYKTFLEEAKKRDHRKLGQELDLFTFSDMVGPGLPLFTPRGAFVRDAIANTIQAIQAKYGFERVFIPHITKKDLYECSGHWDKFKDDLFHVHGKSDTHFVMKPMNCPHHTQIFASQNRSYRDLPIRYAEVTTCYRDEQAGELMGLSRVRALTQDDGHIFCRVDQIKAEVKNIVAVIREFYTKLGMFTPGQFRVSLSVRDPATPEKYLGLEENWNKAEDYLKEIAEEEGLPYERVEGEAAFYGPKLDFMFRDAIGREWQLATAQLDFVQPERFDLHYTGSDGKHTPPVMIHRAIAGSLERFMSVILEHFAGVLPVWLAPEQARLVPVSTDFIEPARAVLAELRAAGVRVTLDDSDDSLGKKVRNAEKMKIPYALVVGEKELADGTLSVRPYGTRDQEVVKVQDFVQKIQAAS